MDRLLPGTSSSARILITLSSAYALGRPSGDQAGSAIDSYLDYLVKNRQSGKALGILEELAREHPGKQGHIADSLQGAVQARVRRRRTSSALHPQGDP